MSEKTNNQPISFIDLFAGIGGFHQAFRDIDPAIKCVFVNEFDSHAKTTYIHNHKKHMPELADKNNAAFWEDITNITLSKTDAPEREWKASIRKTIPPFNILCAGFPCQPFSQAGYKRGFEDARGTLFFDILRIIEARRPEAIFLENVRNLATHDDGKTFATIRKHLNQLGYEVPDEESKNWKIVRASEHGLPTYRARVFIVAFHPRVKNRKDFRFPDSDSKQTTLRDLFGKRWPDRIGYTLRVGGKDSGLHDRRNWDAYLVGGKEHRITPEEGKLMMGFPSDFEFPTSVSRAQAMKQLGNSVAVNAVRATAQEILKVLR